jgi:hypothetical protein
MLENKHEPEKQKAQESSHGAVMVVLLPQMYITNPLSLLKSKFKRVESLCHGDLANVPTLPIRAWGETGLRFGGSSWEPVEIVQDYA